MEEAQHFSTIALIGRYQTPDLADSILALSAYLRSRGMNVLLEDGTSASTGIEGYPSVSYDTIGAEADVAIVLGGDGTMLNAARRLAEYNVPLVGVNEGRLGFLTDIPRYETLQHICELLEGKFTLEERVLLDIEVLRGKKRALHTLAMNEIAVSKGGLGHMIELDVKVDSTFLYVLRADGIIVTTPTGSTAYGLSANGPILHPSVSGIAIVPLCPHSLTYRPITISDSCVVEVTVLAPYDCRVHFDGQARFDARAGDCMRISRSPHTVKLLHPPGHTYFAMLREKLHWSSVAKN